MSDTYRHKGLRKKLVRIISEKGITDTKVLKAIETIPRHLFIGSGHDEHAYEDKAFPIAKGQTISQPYTVAFMTQILKIKKGEKVLEVGTGSGYQSVVLAEMGARVYSIERHYDLFETTKKLLASLKYHHIKLYFGDGFEGLPAFAPFDKIIITAAAPKIPEKLTAQLINGGIMILPMNDGEHQQMIRLTKNESGEISTEKLGGFKFVPMLKGKEW